MNSYECITCVRDKEKDEECKQTIYCHRSKHQDGRCCILQEVEYMWNNTEELFITPPPLRAQFNICLTVRGESLFYSVPWQTS